MLQAYLSNDPDENDGTNEGSEEEDEDDEMQGQTGENNIDAANVLQEEDDSDKDD